MKKSLSILLGWMIVCVSYAQTLTTGWASAVNPDSPLPEYPRPQMERKNNWVNLNGQWDYAITGVETGHAPSLPATFDGKIVVPFAVESMLSGVGKTVGKEHNLWYQRRFVLPKNSQGKKILLHFGGVDWRSEVFINGQQAGLHEGGFDPFTFDITAFVSHKKEQELTVKVWDPSNDGPQPRGKQVKKPEGIWYSPVTGIWQTVWLEVVPETYIVALKQTPDIDNQQLNIEVETANLKSGDQINITAYDGETIVGMSHNGWALRATPIQIKNPKLWSPEHPFLYDLKISIERKGKVIDEVKSYFAMRKISMQPDKNGIQRMMLNNEFVFQYGLLDQGWFPDGLYTAPTDDALKFDIEKTKEMGFNLIRKHAKTEPARWYYYCDVLGMLVWQDMPSGDNGGNRWESNPSLLSVSKGHDKIRSEASEKIYRTEWNAIMDALYPFPCIVVWTPFNEAWGQFKTVEITDWTMQKDPSRLVNSASGGSFFFAGPIIDLHHYSEPAMPRPELFGATKAIVLGEFGGLSLPIAGHTWQEKDNWGYQNLKSSDELLKKYSKFVDDLEVLIEKGLSAAVYTQTTDVEVETNGLMTYDRRIIKIPADELKRINQKVYNKALVK
ncbi:beta-galactosidase [Bacteroidia bacterium]|nr:beta-galactosidase [Bacteroidia bacterium]